MTENANKRASAKPKLESRASKPNSSVARKSPASKASAGTVPSAREGGKPRAASAEPQKRKKVPTAETKGMAQSSLSAEGKRRTRTTSAEGKDHAGVASAEGKGRQGAALAEGKPRTGANASGKGPDRAPNASPQAATQRRHAGNSAPGRGTRARKANRKTAPKGIQANPVAVAANQRSASSRRRGAAEDFFLERGATAGPTDSDGTPPRGRTALFGAVNACLTIAIVVLVALGVRIHSQYGDFLAMREVVDKQTFYEGTTVDGVDVSKMTLSNALDYWRNRVEARNAGRTVTLEDGTAVTAAELGYASDYESVLTAAWSMGRSGTLEERYRMASSHIQNPAAYVIHRVPYNDTLVNQFVQLQSLKIDQPPADATVADFNVDTYEFTFNPSRTGRQLDAVALKRDLLDALEGGGGSVALRIAELPPEITTEQIGQMYGLIDYAVTNASSSSKARLNNIRLALSMINGVKLSPGETFSFNDRVGERTAERGFQVATAFSGGEVTEQVGGGICQVSTTLFNAAVKADMQIDERHNHSLTVAYVDKGKDATVDWGHQDLKFTNTSADSVYICCYLTDDKRVRFGVFGRLLPNGEKITLDAMTTEAIKYQTEYQPDPTLSAGETVVSQNGRDGYKAEAYKVRWDADGNELSRELLCSSIYKVKNEIILYG